MYGSISTKLVMQLRNAKKNGEFFSSFNKAAEAFMMGRTPKEILALANIDPELDQILKNSPPIPPLDPDIDILKLRAAILARKRQLARASLVSTVEVPYVEEDQQIPVRDGSSIKVRIHKPKVLPEDGCPIFVVYHGGGFTLGNLDDEAILCRSFTELGGIAVNVDYRLAPEHPFPVPIEDAFDALKWTSANFKELGGNPKKGFLAGGISAGGNFGAIVALLYRDEKLSPPLTGSYLSIPACMTVESVPEKYKAVFLSREQNASTPILNKSAMKLFDRHYNSDKSSKLAYPINFESHAGLPPTYFQICGMDPLRDDALIYEEILREENGVKTLVDIYPGLPHGFWSYWTEAGFTKKFRHDCVKGMKWLLEQSK